MNSPERGIEEGVHLSFKRRNSGRRQSKNGFYKMKMGFADNAKTKLVVLQQTRTAAQNPKENLCRGFLQALGARIIIRFRGGSWKPADRL